MDRTERGRPDIPVEDPDRRQEVELTARLIVAANESAATLTQGQIDTILDIAPRG
jgi:hypothetical protein